MRDALNFPFGESQLWRPTDTVTKMDLTASTSTSGGIIYLPYGVQNSVVPDPGFDVLAIGFNLTAGDTPGTITTPGVLGLYALYGSTPTALLVTSLYPVPSPSSQSQYFPPASEFYGYPASPTNPPLPTYSAAVATAGIGSQVESNMDLTKYNASLSTSPNLDLQFQPVYPKLAPSITVSGTAYPLYALQFLPQTQGVTASAGHQYVFPYCILRRRKVA